MKYIKQFEELTDESYYMVIKGGTDDILFLMVILDDNGTQDIYKYTTYSLYVYDKFLGLKDSKNKKIMKMDKYYIEKKELFKSKKLNDCITFMETYFDSNKYNL